MPEMKKIYGRTAMVSEILGIKPDLATKLSGKVNEAWNKKATETLAQVVRELKLKGADAYTAYCLGRIVEKNKRGDFGVKARNFRRK